MIKNCLFLLCTFILSGCIGSYIIHDDMSGHDYDSLSTVPDRPQAPDLKTYQKEIDRLEKDHTQAFEQKNRLGTLHKPAQFMDQ